MPYIQIISTGDAAMIAKPKRTLHERIIDADERCARYLADANEAEESGQHAKAEKLFAKSGYWRDRYNLLAGNADRPSPRN
jgi:hypothetical protein